MSGLVRGRDASGIIAGATAARPGPALEQRYSALLHQHVEGLAKSEIDFFVNARRLNVLDRLIGSELRRDGVEILNAASGPFAMEFYLPLPLARIIASFDIDVRLAGLHRHLVGEGLIQATRFEVAGIETYQPQQTFDAVIINDVFYSKYIDFFAVIGRYAAAVKPGGLLYFDIQDSRAGPLWHLLRDDSEWRRYDLGEVKKTLAGLGLTVIAEEPSLGVKGGLDQALRKALWTTTGIANNHIFVARKAGAA